MVRYDMMRREISIGDVVAFANAAHGAAGPETIVFGKVSDFTKRTVRVDVATGNGNSYTASRLPRSLYVLGPRTVFLHKLAGNFEGGAHRAGLVMAEGSSRVDITGRPIEKGMRVLFSYAIRYGQQTLSEGVVDSFTAKKIRLMCGDDLTHEYLSEGRRMLILDD